MNGPSSWSAEGGAALHSVATILGVRITSYVRTREENDRVGGAPNSGHVIGACIDVGKETPGWKLGILKGLSVGATDGLHEKGTAPHYHYTGGPQTLWRLGAVAAAAAVVLKGASDRV